MNQGRFLVLDIGMRRVGVAVGEREVGMVFPRPVIARRDEGYRNLMRDLRVLIETEDPETVVIGLPLKPDGADGPMTVEARTVAERLAKVVGAEVVLQDERLSSFSAEERLKDAGMRGIDTKPKVDSASACVIGEEWLASLRSA